ncbi:MAG: Maf family protein [Proteobacteria bacterium]|nr:Maf family protein [Pseudomonadota bacterium]
MNDLVKAAGPCLILASGSPRRRELLEQLGLKFDIRPADLDESVQPGERADRYVTRLSAEKANAGYEAGTVVLAADTTVVLGQDILGKPVSRQDAVLMLLALSGSTHEVLTGVTVMSDLGIDTVCVRTSVKFRELGLEEIEFYWSTGEPVDKAGAYGLQGIGSVFVVSLDGSYSNVIGLPLVETIELLRRHGVACLGVTASQPNLIKDSHHG